jgi:hypothetical protein
VNRNRLAVLAAIALVASARILPAQTPTGYTFSTPTLCGTWCYSDETGNQLTDGLLGVDAWAYNSGYDYVGWKLVNPTINFFFSSVHNFNSVRMGFLRNEEAKIFLPLAVTVNGTRFDLTGNEIADKSRGWLTFDGNWAGQQIDVTADYRRWWLFTDEVEFGSLPPVALDEVSDARVTPEPASVVLFASGLIAIGGIARRRRQSKQG